MSTKFNAKGYHPPYVKAPELCVNCDLCEMICPEFAIFCIGDREQEDGTGTRQEGTS
jgi:2-oxoglutarate ferredoxin oxidoreductase subunit delta